MKSNELINELSKLQSLMIKCSYLLKDNYGESCQHSIELNGAARMVDEWIINITLGRIEKETSNVGNPDVTFDKNSNEK